MRFREVCVVWLCCSGGAGVRGWVCRVFVLLGALGAKGRRFVCDD